MKSFEDGELFVYINGDKAEIGKVKRINNKGDGYFAMLPVAITGLILVAIAGAVIWGVWALFHLDWKTSEEVVSGIVYDATFDDWPGHNTTFKIRAAAEMAVTEGTSPTYCLPSGSPYESIVREAAEDKDIKVVVKVKQMPLHFRESAFRCEDNVEVTKKEEK